MKLSPARIGSWIWILIYGGMFLLCVGFALQQQGRLAGAGVMLAGALAAAVGVVLIWVRSRMGDAADADPLHPESTPEARHEHPRP